uniref:Uncharacterized protein n=1 Tax=Aegilops tauschii subsp. strangulata TaxID=200361 RepID=A0A453KYC9_AEGTS
YPSPPLSLAIPKNTALPISTPLRSGRYGHSKISRHPPRHGSPRAFLLARY